MHNNEMTKSILWYFKCAIKIQNNTRIKEIF